MQTRTGKIPIGFRRLRFSPWQQDLGQLIAWAKGEDFPFIDLGPEADAEARQVTEAGMAVGSADLPDWQGMISAEAGRRRGAVEKSNAYIERCAGLGIRNFFMVMLPAKPEAGRAANFGVMVEALNALSPVLERSGSRLVMEGWPGEGALCCTPETIRAVFKACGSASIGLNYDPSHLLRMNIDPLRFLEEFAGRVYHVHGKDTEIFSEALYEYGSEQEPTWGKGHDFGGVTWRYAIPGQGSFRWRRGLEILEKHGYGKAGGLISVELEDEHFNGSEAGEKRGLVVAAEYLANC